MDQNGLLTTPGLIRDNPFGNTTPIVCQYCGVSFPPRDAYVLLNHLQIVHSGVDFEQFRNTVLGIAMDLRNHDNPVNYNLNAPYIRNAVDQVLGTSGTVQVAPASNVAQNLDESDNVASSSGSTSISVTTTDTSNFYKISGSTTSPSGDTSHFLARIDKKWNVIGHYTEMKQLDQARISRGAAPTATYKEKRGIVKRYYKCKNCKYYMMSWQNRNEGALYEYGNHNESCTIVSDLLNQPAKENDEETPPPSPEISAETLPNYVNAVVKAVPLDAYQLCCLNQIAFEHGLTFVIENSETGAFSMQRRAEFLKFEVSEDGIKLLWCGDDGVEYSDSWPGTLWGYFLVAIRKKCGIVFDC